ncbi:DUF4854 domain-containing protein [Cellulomonas septica]|uniref:Lipoprotein n=1 Tax=Cellulomonas septica TaxID=285080 RepID=A0ABX1JWJ2_9CELL|nr:hypothetical protein [Cellulomonas septica]NKY38665.1 hypothetical protein [Cellulomonas septica]
MQTTTRRAAAALLIATALSLTAACSSSSPEAEETTTAAPTKEAPATDTEATDDSADSGDDQAAALDAYVTALQATVPQLMSQFDGTYSAITITGEQPSTVVYTYTYAEQLDAPATASALDGQVDQLQEVCDSAVFPEMEGQGITTDPQVRYVYVNADGAEIWSHTFAKS